VHAVSLTGAPPPLPATLATPVAAGDNGTQAVIGILDARAPDRLAGSVADVLHAASGPGNIITGRVTEIQPNGTVFLATSSGAELSFRHPPEVPLDLGSTVTLRLVATVPAPQAVLLAVDGRAVAGLLGRAAAARQAGLTPDGTATGSVPAAGSPPAAFASGSTGPATGPRSGAAVDFGIGLATQLVAALGADDARSGDGAGIPGAGVRAAAPEPAGGGTISPPVVAVLLRSAPPRPGATPPAVGTRYLLTVEAVAPPGAGEDVAAGPPNVAPARPAPLPEAPAPVGTHAASAVPVPAAATAAPTELEGFTLQAAVLVGRATAPRQPAEVLVETVIGTLSIPLPEALVPAGSAVQLRIAAVARPLPTDAVPATEEGATTRSPGLTTAGDAALPPSPLQAALAALAALEPSIARDAAARLILPPGAGLAAAIFGFLAGIQGGATRRWADSPARGALDALDRGDLREKLDGDAGMIGSEIPPAQPGDWKVTVMPYFGAESVRPVRLYQRAVDVRVEADGSKSASPGQRFVVEIELRRLGPLQFDGLVRDRRFDLALRSAQPLEAALQDGIARIFRDAVGIGGYAGELVFGRLARFPLLPPTAQLEVHEISA
jgi:hypothetical protein